MIKDIIEKWLGIDQIKEKAKAEALQSIQLAREAEEAAKEADRIRREAIQEAIDATAEAEKIKKEAEQAKMSPKEKATLRGEPWVAVLDTKVDFDNLNNGFFELDWNEEFIVQLKKAGYGFDGDPEEEIVDRWFRELARSMLEEEGLDPSRGAGYINVARLGQGKSEIS